MVTVTVGTPARTRPAIATASPRSNVTTVRPESMASSEEHAPPGPSAPGGSRRTHTSSFEPPARKTSVSNACPRPRTGGALAMRCVWSAKNAAAIPPRSRPLSPSAGVRGVPKTGRARTSAADGAVGACVGAVCPWRAPPFAIVASNSNAPPKTHAATAAPTSHRRHTENTCNRRMSRSLTLTLTQSRERCGTTSPGARPCHRAAAMDRDSRQAAGQPAARPRRQNDAAPATATEPTRSRVAALERAEAAQERGSPHTSVPGGRVRGPRSRQDSRPQALDKTDPPLRRLERHLDDPADELVEADAGGVGRLRQEAPLGGTWDRVGLEDGQLAGLLVEHEIDAREAAAAEQAEDVHGEPMRALGDRVAELGGADERRAADRVARGEVVEVLLARHGLDDRQRVVAEDRDREGAAVDVALEEDLVRVRERRHERGRHVGRRAGEADAERAALVGGLDDDRELEALLDVAERLGRAELLERGLGERVERGRREAGVEHRVLREHLVGAAHAGRDPRGGVRDAEDLEELLDRAVLAVAAVHRDERHVGRLGAQTGDEVPADVDADDVVAEALQRVLDPRARAQGPLPLERPAALQHGDAAHRASDERRPRSWGGGRCSTSARSAAGRGPSRSDLAGGDVVAPVSVP